MTLLADVYPAYSAEAGWGDKGTAHNYLPTYQREITRTHGVTLLEIGVMHGHSIAMWNAWLTDSTVTGIDVDLSRVRFDLPNLHVCNAADPRDVQRVLGDATFDYVIDDGDHNVQVQLAVLDLFLPRVNPGGAYFIEDIRTTHR